VGLARAHPCAACGGAWVPFESCEAVMRRLAELAPAQAPAAPPAGPDKLKCPGCGGDLVAVKAHGAGGVVVRTCLVCFGRWVDGWELGRTRGRGLLGLVKALLRALSPKEKPPRAAPQPAARPPAEPPAEESARTEVPKQD